MRAFPAGVFMTGEALKAAIADGSIEEKYGDLPYGVMYCTGGMHPAVLYANDRMRSFMGIKAGAAEYSYLLDDVYLSIPYTDRKQFGNDLLRAAVEQGSIEVSHSFITISGRQIRLTGWIKSQNGGDYGKNIYKATYQPPQQNIQADRSVINAIINAYDVVVRMDKKNKYCEFIKCRTLKNENIYKGLKILMNNNLDSTMKSIIKKEDIPGFMALTEAALNENASCADTPIECRFRFIHNGSIDTYYCTYVRFGLREVYICCRLLERKEEEKAEEAEKTQPEKEIKIRTFGYFDVFIDGKAIPFKNKKAKELLALLTARSGGFVSPDEIVGCLWENETVNKSTLARIRKTYFELCRELAEYGISDILESKGSERRIIPEKITVCDLFDHLNGTGSGGKQQLFMRNYPWGEYISEDIFGEDLIQM